MTTQSSGAFHGQLRTSIEVACQALADSRHLAVHTELGVKLTTQPTWMDTATLLLRALEASPLQRLSTDEVNEVREASVCDFAHAQCTCMC